MASCASSLTSSSIRASNAAVAAPKPHLALQKLGASTSALTARPAPASSLSSGKRGSLILGTTRCDAASSHQPGSPVGVGGGSGGASDCLNRAAREFFSANQGGHHHRAGELTSATNNTSAPHSAASPAAAPTDNDVDDSLKAREKGGIQYEGYLPKDEDMAWSQLIQRLSSATVSAGERGGDDALSAAVLETTLLPEIALVVDVLEETLSHSPTAAASAADAATPAVLEPSGASSGSAASPAAATSLPLLRPDGTNPLAASNAAAATATATVTAAAVAPKAALVNGNSSKSTAVAPNSVINPSSLPRHGAPATPKVTGAATTTSGAAASAAVAGATGSWMSGSGAAGGSDGGANNARSSTSPSVGYHGAAAVSAAPMADATLAAASAATVTEGRRGVGERQGLGILPYLKGKHILITGATGFLAKALVEKILREQPDVGQLYLLIQPRGDTTAHQRLYSQVLPSAIFSHLKQEHGEGYDEFMSSKLTAVDGNIGEERLGLSEVTMAALADRVDVIINSAATTDFDARYDVALNINTLGPRRLLAFAKQCRQLQLLLHVSTAYVNGKRKGRAMERPFAPGDSIAAELLAQASTSPSAAAAAAASIPTLDVDGEIAFAARERAAVEAAAVARGASKDEVAAAVNTHMSALGRARAQVFGWQDAYVLSKAMGEMTLGEQRGEAEEAVVPVVVVRPSIVESALCEPMAGWMEGMRMADPILMAYGKGAMSGFFAGGVCDMIPVDFVVNAILAIAVSNAKLPPQGTSTPSSSSTSSGYQLPRVYHVTTSVANPLSVTTVADAATQHFADNPMKQKDGTPISVPPAKVFRFPQLFILDLWIKYQLPMMLMKVFPKKGKANARRTTIMMKTIESLMHFAKIYSPYTFYEARFDSSNTEDLFTKMSLEEQQKFNFNVRNINWHNYMCHVHIPGLRKFVMKGRGSKDM